MTVTDLGWVPAGVDVNQPSAARVYDYYLGGWHYFPADRWVAERATANVPGLPTAVRAHRAFLQRAVRYLTTTGVRQFIDLGSGIPTAGHVHEIAHAVDPGVRVVYVDVDPVAVAHGQAMLAGRDTATMVRADLRDVPLVLAAPPLRKMIDFSEPVGVLMVAVLHLLPDADDPAGVVARYRDALPTGSHLAISHPVRPAGQPSAATDEGQPRSRAEVTAMFAGWDIVEPGLTDVRRWHADATDGRPTGPVPDLAGVARKS